MRKLIAMLMLVAATCSASEIYRPSTSEGVYIAMEGGYYVWTSAAIPPTSALILEYLMAANGDEANITLDTSPNNYTGTVHNATWSDSTNGIIHNYYFNGTTSWMDIDPVQGIFTNCTVSFWFKAPAGTTTDYFLDSNGDERFVIQSLDNATMRVTDLDASTGRLLGPIQYNETWNMITLVFNGIDDTVTHYENGVIVGTNIYLEGHVPFNGNVSLMASSAGAGARVKGNIWDFQIYDGIRTSEELLTATQVQAVQLGILSGWSTSDLDAFTNRSSAIATCSTFQDFFGNDISSPDLPAQAGNPTVGWWSGNGVAEHAVITVSNATNIMFTAGADNTSMTNFAIIDGVQYADGIQQAFANTYYESTATSNVFLRYSGSSFYDGIISQIHCGTFTPTDYTNWHNWVEANITWN